MPSASAELRGLATQYAARLLERGYQAVAATGSVARGDAIVGSDIDLWALGDADEVFHDSIGGRSVTIFGQSLANAVTLANLSLFDVESLWVIADDTHLFERIRSVFEKNRERIFAGIFDTTVREVFTCLQLSRRGSALARVVYLREAALRIAALDVGRRKNLRVPRYRHFSESYGHNTLASLRVALGVEGCRSDDRKRIIRYAPSYAKSLGRTFSEVLPQASRVAVPVASLRRLASGEVEEALLSLRARFEQQCIMPLRQIHPGIDVVDGGIRKLPRPVVRFFEAMHLFSGSERQNTGRVAKTRAALSSFVRATQMDRVLSVSFYLGEAA